MWCFMLIVELSHIVVRVAGASVFSVEPGFTFRFVQNFSSLCFAVVTK